MEKPRFLKIEVFCLILFVFLDSYEEFEDNILIVFNDILLFHFPENDLLFFFQDLQYF